MEGVLPWQIELESTVKSKADALSAQTVHGGTGCHEQSELPRDLLPCTEVDDEFGWRTLSPIVVARGVLFAPAGRP